MNLDVQLRAVRFATKEIRRERDKWRNEWTGPDNIQRAALAELEEAVAGLEAAERTLKALRVVEAAKAALRAALEPAS